jgi:hypothetical protein
MIGSNGIEQERPGMAKKIPTVLSLTAALAALSGVTAVAPTPAAANTTSDEAITPQGRTNTGQANVFMPVGQDLLGLIVTTSADGTVVAQHDSHYSHSSHASHRSHYSSN